RPFSPTLAVLLDRRRPFSPTLAVLLDRRRPFSPTLAVLLDRRRPFSSTQAGPSFPTVQPGKIRTRFTYGRPAHGAWPGTPRLVVWLSVRPVVSPVRADRWRAIAMAVRFVNLRGLEWQHR